MTRSPAPKGVFAAVSTPVDSQFRPDCARFLDHSRWLLENGCVGLAPLGTTGEANSFGLRTRLALIEAMVTGGIPMNRVIVGAGAPSIEDTVEVSRAAIDAGANGLLLLPPFYYKNPSEAGLFSFYATVAERVGEMSPRFFLYHIPQMSAVPITISLARRLREAFPGMFVGLKDSSGDFENTRAFIEAFPGLEAFAGAEIFAVQTLEIGGWGCISATTNVSAPVVAERILSKDSKKNKRLDEDIARMRSLIAGLSTVGGTKAAISVFRNDREWTRVVPPNDEVDEETAKKLAGDLDRLGNLRRFFR